MEKAKSGAQLKCHPEQQVGAVKCAGRLTPGRTAHEKDREFKIFFHHLAIELYQWN